MIVFHKGQDARERIEKVVMEADGDTYRLAPGTRLADGIDAISGWIANTASPTCIIVDPAVSEGEEDLEAYRTLRRMAKFSGIDVHLTGGAGEGPLDDVIDRVVANDADMELSAPGTQVGGQIASLMQSESMTPFERAEMDVPNWQEIMAMSSCTEAEAKEKAAWLSGQAVWVNNIYQVNVEFMQGGRAHLIIRRQDKQAIHNWQHFFEIKNQLLGPECEAVEVYPKGSQLIDEKHHYHLWGFRSPKDTFGIGFQIGRQAG